MMIFTGGVEFTESGNQHAHRNDADNKRFFHLHFSLNKI